MGLAFNVFFVTFIIIGTSAIFTEAKQSSHCLRGITVKDILMLAGIKGADLLSYVAKMKAENIDQTVVSSLTYKQLGNIGISKIGDRHKLHKFLSKDGNDCNNSVCKNNGICRDGFRCFSCICDPTSGYYGLTCQRKCPCLNGGVCKTVPTGFKCVCPPGYSGNLCKMKYLTKERFLQMENSLTQVNFTYINVHVISGYNQLYSSGKNYTSVVQTSYYNYYSFLYRTLILVFIFPVILRNNNRT